MTRSDIVVLVTKLQGLYGDRFPALAPAMAEVWLDALRHLDEDLVQAGLLRWARQHTFKAPSLDELLEQVEIVREDQQRALRRRTTTGAATYLDALKEAAEAQMSNPVRTPDDATYAKLMVLLAERSIGRWQDSKGVWHEKLTHEQRGEQCYAWADYYQVARPALAQDLRAAARKFGETLFTTA